MSVRAAVECPACQETVPAGATRCPFCKYPMEASQDPAADAATSRLDYHLAVGQEHITLESPGAAGTPRTYHGKIRPSLRSQRLYRWGLGVNLGMAILYGILTAMLMLGTLDRIVSGRGFGAQLLLSMLTTATGAMAALYALAAIFLRQIPVYALGTGTALSGWMAILSFCFLGLWEDSSLTLQTAAFLSMGVHGFLSVTLYRAYAAWKPIAEARRNLGGIRVRSELMT